MEAIWRLKGNSEKGGPDLRFGEGSHLLGCSSDADLLIPNQTVSRSHARFDVTDRGVTIEDIG